MSEGVLCRVVCGVGGIFHFHGVLCCVVLCRERCWGDYTTLRQAKQRTLEENRSLKEALAKMQQQMEDHSWAMESLSSRRILVLG